MSDRPSKKTTAPNLNAFKFIKNNNSLTSVKNILESKRRYIRHAVSYAKCRKGLNNLQ